MQRSGSAVNLVHQPVARLSLLPFGIGDDYFIKMSETELLQAFRNQRSEAAFAELVRRYAGLVYSAAKRRLANATLAEDITQIVFIRFAKTPPAVRNHAELAAWLHRTTINVTIDLWRSESRRRTREQHAVVMESTASETANWEDIASKLDEALDQLNNDDRQVLLLRYFGQKTMREVGTTLGVSEDAAKMRVSRAVDRLRTKLGVVGATCTAAVLSTWLAEHSVEAVPVPLVARLANLKLPAAASVAGMGGLLGALLQISKLRLVVGAVVLALIASSVVRLAHALKTPDIPAPTTDSGADSNLKFAEQADQEWSAPLPKTSASSLGPAPKITTILFHVVDADTGEGLVDAKIHGAYFGTGGQGKAHDLLTDYSGTALIPLEVASKRQCANIFVVAEGHVPKVVSFRGGFRPAEYTLKLDPAVTAGGMVVDELGLPVGGVKIWIRSPGNKPNQAENVDFQTCPVTSRDDGSWTCSYIPKDYTNEIGFILKKSGYAVTIPWGSVDQTGLTNLVLVIKRGFTVTGQITDSQGQPIANAHVKALSKVSGQEQSTTSDGNGVFLLTGITGDSTNEFFDWPKLETNDNGEIILKELSWQGPLHAELAVQAEGFAAQTRTVELAERTNIANFALSPGNIFRGRVVDETGNPIPNAIIQTDYDFKNQIGKQFAWMTYTDGNGRFEWDSAPTGEVCYWFEADGYQWIRGLPLAADGSEHEITLKHEPTP